MFGMFTAVIVGKHVRLLIMNVQPGLMTDAEGGTYYLDPVSGKMATGWGVIDEMYYYFNEASDGKRLEGGKHLMDIM